MNDSKDWVFHEGLGIYQDITPVSEQGARKALGRLGKEHGWKALQTALRAVRAEKPREAYSYLKAILNAAPPEAEMAPAPPKRMRSDGQPLPSDEDRKEILGKIEQWRKDFYS